jgi:hypothetical protein
MTKWFYQFNQTVKGPVTTHELENLIPSFQDLQRTYVWSRGHSEWISANRWKPDMEIIQSISPAQPLANTAIHKDNATKTLKSIDEIVQAADEVTKTIVPSEDKTVVVDNTSSATVTKKTQEKFRVQVNFIDQPAMTKAELTELAARIEDPSQIGIYDSVAQKWSEIYTFKDIVEKLGLSRRKHPRVPILAQFSGSSSRHEKFSARLVTISIGGIGLTDVFDLKIGDKIYGQITSPHFYSPVAIEADVTYSGKDGYVGFKFSQISDESQSLVTNYIKRFS